MNYARPYRSTPPEDEHSNVNPPMVYASESLHWEYKHLSRNLKQSPPPAESDLNEYGKDGWELVSSLIYADTAHFYFKRLKK